MNNEPFKFKMLAADNKKFAAVTLLIKHIFLKTKDYNKHEVIKTWLLTHYDRAPFFTKFINRNRLETPMCDTDHLKALAVLLHIIQHGDIYDVIKFYDLLFEVYFLRINDILKNTTNDKMQDYGFKGGDKL